MRHVTGASKLSWRWTCRRIQSRNNRSACWKISIAYMAIWNSSGKASTWNIDREETRFAVTLPIWQWVPAWGSCWNITGWSPWDIPDWSICWGKMGWVGEGTGLLASLKPIKWQCLSLSFYRLKKEVMMIISSPEQERTRNRIWQFTSTKIWERTTWTTYSGWSCALSPQQHFHL